ncbi:MAG: hypothetical protein PHN82_08900 [bacterium]|nr:hypothetical protein [bacterium]
MAVAMWCVITAPLCLSQIWTGEAIIDEGSANSAYSPAVTAELLYYTSFTGVVNGLSANLLLPENSDQFGGFFSGAMYYPHICKIWADIFVRHADGTEIQIGDGVASWSISCPPAFSGYVYCDWACPATELAVTDSIRIQEWIQVGTSRNSADFTTGQLGACSLKQSTWTFRRYLQSEGKYDTIFQFFYGHPAHASYIDGITLWPMPIRITFQPASSTPPPRYLPSGTEAYDEARGYGWR